MVVADTFSMILGEDGQEEPVADAGASGHRGTNQEHRCSLAAGQQGKGRTGAVPA